MAKEGIVPGAGIPGLMISPMRFNSPEGWLCILLTDSNTVKHLWYLPVLTLQLVWSRIIKPFFYKNRPYSLYLICDILYIYHRLGMNQKTITC